MDAIKVALIAGAAYVGYKVVQAQKDINQFVRVATPLANDARNITGNVSALTSSLAGVTNTVFAIGKGLQSAFASTNSGINAPSAPRAPVNNFLGPEEPFLQGSQAGWSTYNGAVANPDAAYSGFLSIPASGDNTLIGWGESFQ